MLAEDFKNILHAYRRTEVSWKHSLHFIKLSEACENIRKLEALYWCKVLEHMQALFQEKTAS